MKTLTSVIIFLNLQFDFHLLVDYIKNQIGLLNAMYVVSLNIYGIWLPELLGSKVWVWILMLIACWINEVDTLLSFIYVLEQAE